MKFTIEVYDFLYCCKHESKYSRIPCFVEKNFEATIKICGISNQSLWFSTTSTYNSFHSSLQNYVSKNFSPTFQNFLLLNNPQFPHHDQNQQEFKIQTNKVP